MRSKKLMLGIIVILGLIVIGSYNKLNDKYSEVNGKNEKSSALSIMIESDVSGEYELSKDSVWPSEGYVFNEEKSYCENEGEITYDTSTHKIAVITDKTDKCYAYFDKYSSAQTLVAYIKSLYTAQGTNNLYLHDSTLENGAEDGSYRYAGADPSNYVCFGSDEKTCPEDNLYRIIGVFGDNVKLIKADYATSALLGTDGDYASSITPNNSYYKGSQTSIGLYYWNNSTQTNTWSESGLNTINLNTNFINKIGSSWANKIEEMNWNIGGNTTAGSTAKTFYNVEKSTTYKTKIGLMTLSEYGYATVPENWTTYLRDYEGTVVNNNWIYIGYYESSITRKSTGSDGVFCIEEDGLVALCTADMDNGIRPAFSLKSTVTLTGGEGTKTLPYRIK